VKANEPVPHPLLELIKARLREFVREPGYVFWVFGFPLLMAIGLGLAFRERTPERPRVALVGELKTELESALLSSPRILAERASAAQGRRALDRTKLDLIVEAEGERIVLRFDASQDRGVLARGVVQDVLERAAGRRDLLRFREEKVSERGSRYIDFLMPGLIGLNLMGSSMWGVGFNLVLARKRRLLRRYAVTPMRRSHFLLSYVFSRTIFLVLELAVLVAFGHLVFGTSIQGSVFGFILTSFVGAAAFAAISLIIGARLESTEVANGWMNFVQLPMWLLSGSFFSYERFPEWLEFPIRLLPLTAVNDALRAVYNDAAALSALWFELGVLSVWTLLGFGIALRSFRWH
jgi:ABC-type multidrug transport system permease subunit